MTNEELAVKIQGGEKALIPLLWQQTSKLIIALFKKLLRRSEGSQGRCISAGVTLDDLEQEGYFALLQAVEAYRPEEEYKFTTYLRYPVMNRFYQTIGIRTVRQRGDLLSKADSLDRPVGGNTESITLGDSIANSEAAEAMEAVVVGAYREELHNALEICLATLPADQEQVIREKFYMGRTCQEIALARGCAPEWPSVTLNKGLRKLRGGKSVVLLRPFAMEDTGRQYFGGGFQSFVHSGASSVELAVERLERRGNHDTK